MGDKDSKNVCAFLLYESGERVSLDITRSAYMAMAEAKRSGVDSGAAKVIHSGVDIHNLPFSVDVGSHLMALSATPDDDDEEEEEEEEEEETECDEEACDGPDCEIEDCDCCCHESKEDET